MIAILPIFMASLVDSYVLSVSSAAFTHNGVIPAKYTCEGDNINPPLWIEHIPPGAVSMVLIVDDPDAPGGTFDHWIVWNIPPISTIEENSIPGIQGKNSALSNKYTGPCPPTGQHRYFFKIYILDTLLDLPEGSNKKTVERAMQDHILATAELIGLYQKAK